MLTIGGVAQRKRRLLVCPGAATQGEATAGAAAASYVLVARILRCFGETCEVALCRLHICCFQSSCSTRLARRSTKTIVTCSAQLNENKRTPTPRTLQLSLMMTSISLLLCLDHVTLTDFMKARWSAFILSFLSFCSLAFRPLSALSLIACLALSITAFLLASMISLVLGYGKVGVLVRAARCHKSCAFFSSAASSFSCLTAASLTSFDFLARCCISSEFGLLDLSTSRWSP